MSKGISIAEAGRQLRSGQTSSVALTQTALARIASRDPGLNAFVLLTEERAMEDARRADAEMASGVDRGPMHGIPHALKDIIGTAGIRTTCHSKLRLDIVPETDSAVAAKFAEGGAVLLGKLATHEFAIGGPSFDLPFPPARNPWNREHIPSGSSSGSAAAVGSGMVRMAMGSDTGGSIRGPAGYCGLVGLKPTYGRVSRRGVFPLSTTLDHLGPLSVSIEDAAIALQVIAGYDPLDAGSADMPVPDYRTSLDAGVAGLRIGIPRAHFATAQSVSPEVLATIDRTAALLREAGAIVEDVELPDFALFSACGRTIMISEAYSIHESDLRERPGDYGAITYSRFIYGAAITAGDIWAALRLRRELTDAVDSVLEHYDALLTASTLIQAPRFDVTLDPRAAAAVIQTIQYNVTGHPALSVPTEVTKQGMPIGVQIAGRAWDEATVLRIGRAIEVLTGWESLARPDTAS
jgi:aspartyl-tRNA(Asn)/glutamyl-tRNA(Gln) amidotransferase subunit A